MSELLVLGITIVAYYFIIFARNVKKSIITFFFGTLLFILKPVEGLEFENVGNIVSFETLGILLGMMIIVEILKESGFFTFVAINAIKMSRYKFWVVIFLIMLVIALFSAFLDNLITIMLMAPIIFLIADTLEVNPIPFLMLSIYIDNIGGMSTLIGSPLNIVLGSIGELDFATFLGKMLPITAISFLSVLFIFKVTNKVDSKVYNQRLKEKLSTIDPTKAIENKSLMYKGIIVFAIVLAGFMFHSAINIDLALIAVIGALTLMLLTQKDFESMSKDLDWDTMFFYAGLFTIAYSLEEIGVTQAIAHLFDPLMGTPKVLMIVIAWISAFTIPFLSAVPGTLIMAPVIKLLVMNGAPFDLWYAYAIGANLGTNLTPLGAVQNLVGVSLLEKNYQKTITFAEYMKMSVLPVLIPLILGTAYLIFFF
ncbi:Na+/H+ antiporter NhaD-like permease [Marinitoga piezophila KA3]|uniref:Na+/H+ antiporter NhaD-like permease n=1 Tax=Marinitoga piezophila (strain DSM 14283 / JCM 11233 / KA3) TaxID=443254 RepID=H2J5I8_MARPK|nr:MULTISPECIES: SLC13 family permease [Marinitoga]AEX86132.1 Na+/H+ antiporter NhaD-like permease [Marinitoga piezophila KA3]